MTVSALGDNDKASSNISIWAIAHLPLPSPNINPSLVINAEKGKKPNFTNKVKARGLWGNGYEMALSRKTN